ncbi:hypothetical protein M0R45_009260 [Rubus argutus]|uniref:Uncharacterized protein n=1 Tax=Rubus argutus TaxID=59490 RepID=A0AAW1Y3Z0_RUBAR
MPAETPRLRSIQLNRELLLLQAAPNHSSTVATPKSTAGDVSGRRTSYQHRLPMLFTSGQALLSAKNVCPKPELSHSAVPDCLPLAFPISTDDRHPLPPPSINADCCNPSEAVRCSCLSLPNRCCVSSPEANHQASRRPLPSVPPPAAPR